MTESRKATPGAKPKDDAVPGADTVKDTADDSALNGAEESDETPEGYTRYRSTGRVYAYQLEEAGEVITSVGPVWASAGDYVVKDLPDSGTRVVDRDSFEAGNEED